MACINNILVMHTEATSTYHTVRGGVCPQSTA